MVRIAVDRHDPDVTSQDPKAAGAASAPRPLRRRADDRVLAGVAGGLADYLNIDPVIVRAVFVGLMIFGGAGLVLYVVAWVLIPAADREHSIVESVLARAVAGRGRIVLLAIIGLVLVFILFGQDSAGYVHFPLGLSVSLGFLVVLTLVIAGIALLWRGRREAEGEVVAAAAPMDAEATADLGVVQQPVVRVERRPRVERGPLGWLTVAAALIAIGLLALIDQATDRTVLLGQFLAAVLAIVGIGLIVGSWWGNARLLVLPALLLLPIASAASFVTVPLEGGAGYAEYMPTSIDEVRDEYRLAVGEMRLDLRELEPTGEPIRIEATVGIGDVDVMVPEGAGVDVTGRVGAGGLVLLEAGQSGTHLENRVLHGDAADPDFILIVGVGIGRIEVLPADWLEEVSGLEWLEHIYGPEWLEQVYGPDWFDQLQPMPEPSATPTPTTTPAVTASAAPTAGATQP